MLFRLGRRAIGMATSFFAVLGFIAVPIGDRTAYEHVKVALATPEGREATAALGRAYAALQSRVVDWVVGRVSASAPIKELPTVLDREELTRNRGAAEPNPTTR